MNKVNKVSKVAIVGAGPTGLVLSSLLARAGVVNSVFEKYSRLSDHPQAHYVNARHIHLPFILPNLLNPFGPPFSMDPL